jgi:hypothetical protein
MLTLTEKETKLVDYLLANTDGSDAHICSDEFINLSELNFSLETLKGVFGSLVNKNILKYGDSNENGEVYFWAIPVSEEQQLNYGEYNPINSVQELLIKIKNNQNIKGKYEILN